MRVLVERDLEEDQFTIYRMTAHDRLESWERRRNRPAQSALQARSGVRGDYRRLSRVGNAPAESAEYYVGLLESTSWQTCPQYHVQRCGIVDGEENDRSPDGMEPGADRGARGTQHGELPLLSSSNDLLRRMVRNAMNTRFENAPLVEVVAEVRWSTQVDTLFGSMPPGVPIQISGDVGASTEQFLQRFAVEMDDLGFRNSERMYPPDAPLFPNTPAVRYRRRAGEPPLIQIGNGIFTANGLPPTYSHWGAFRPTLNAGVEALLRSRDESERTQPFTSVTVRYIDAFDAQFWGARTSDGFISEVLGFALNIPGELDEHRDKSRAISMNQQFRVPLVDGGLMSVLVGDGTSNNLPAVVLEVAVEFLNVDPSVEAAMERFEHAHKLINDMFLALTSDIRHLMVPVEARNDV